MLAADKGTLEVVITHGGSYNDWVVFSTAVHYMLSSLWVCALNARALWCRRITACASSPVALLTVSVLGRDYLAHG